MKKYRRRYEYIKHFEASTFIFSEIRIQLPRIHFSVTGVIYNYNSMLGKNLSKRVLAAMGEKTT